MRVVGDVGVVTCVEVLDSGDRLGQVAATNVFEREAGGGEWRIVLHQGGSVLS